MKTKFFFPAVLAFIALAAVSCNRFYKTSDFSEKTRSHKTIAILPFEIVITGRLPKDLTEEQRLKIEEAESVAFQRNFYEKVHIVGTRGGKELTVSVQPIDKTNKLLADNGISIRQSWSEDPQKLAALLGVDAVVDNRAVKQRFLSDLESIGVQIGTSVLSAIFGGTGLGWAGRTNEVEVSSLIIDGKNGGVLFSGRDEITVDWSRPANEAIEQINRRVCRRFPYAK